MIVTKRTNCESLDVDTFAIVNCFAQYFEENKLKVNANKTNKQIKRLNATDKYENNLISQNNLTLPTAPKKSRIVLFSRNLLFIVQTKSLW